MKYQKKKILEKRSYLWCSLYTKFTWKCKRSGNILSLMDSEFFCVKEKLQLLCLPSALNDLSSNSTKAWRLGRFFVPSVYGFRILLDAPCYWQFCFHNAPPPRSCSPGTALGELETPFVWKSLICKFFSVTPSWGSIGSVPRACASDSTEFHKQDFTTCIKFQ
jgi:hypothetical protein